MGDPAPGGEVALAVVVAVLAWGALALASSALSMRSRSGRLGRAVPLVLGLVGFWPGLVALYLVQGARLFIAWHASAETQLASMDYGNVHLELTVVAVVLALADIALYAWHKWRLRRWGAAR